MIVALVPACTGADPSVSSASDMMGPVSTDPVQSSATTSVATTSVATTSVTTTTSVTATTADPFVTELVVPDLAAPTVDGVVDPEEWAGAAPWKLPAE
jgi:hypothetical protein